MRVLRGLGLLAILTHVALPARPLPGESGLKPAELSGEPRTAAPVRLVSRDLLGTYQILAGQSQCFIYTYDGNGNRLTRSNLNPGATATWGSSIYGCSNWTAP